MLHEECLRIIYNNKQSLFKMYLEKDSSLSIHDRNIQCLATEMYNVSNWLSPSLVSNNFRQRNCLRYNLLLNFQFSLPLVRSVFYGTESIFFSFQLSGTLFLTVILMFLKTGLKMEDSELFLQTLQNIRFQSRFYIGFRFCKLDETLVLFTQFSLQT